MQPDVALVDIGLTGLNGFHVAGQVRATVPVSKCEQVRLIALTGYGREYDGKNVLEAGFDVHLVKPVDVKRLLQVLSSVTAGS